jgi:hypothetical protein
VAFILKSHSMRITYFKDQNSNVQKICIKNLNSLVYIYVHTADYFVFRVIGIRNMLKEILMAFFFILSSSLGVMHVQRHILFF